MSKASQKDQFYEPFYLNPYVEKLAYNNERISDKTIEGALLVNTKSVMKTFEEKINDLNYLSDTIDREIYESYSELDAHEKEYKVNIALLASKTNSVEKEYNNINSHIQQISSKISGVAKQLENCSTPSKRAKEAIELISIVNSFVEFSTEPATFENVENLHQSTIMMHHVVSIFKDLEDPKFCKAKQLVEASYKKLVDQVNNEFTSAYQQGDTKTMKECSDTLMPSKEFHTCYTTLIDLCINDFVLLPQDFALGVVNTFNTGCKIIDCVFSGHKRLVMNNFVQSIFEVIIKKRVHSIMTGFQNSEVKAFEALKNLYQETISIEKAILSSNTVVQASTLEMHKKALFGEYLDNYIQEEVQLLKDCYRDLIANSLGDAAVSKNIFSSIQLSAHKIDVATVISHNVAVSMIQDNRLAIERCEILSSSVDLPSNIVQIYMVLIDYLPKIYCNNGIDMALKALPSLNPRHKPSLDFFKLVEQLNIIILFLQKHFTEMIMKTIGLTSHYATCLNQLKIIKQNFESKIQEGIERVLTSYINWIKHILSTEQKQNDFLNCESGVLGTKAMGSVCEAIDYFLQEASYSLEGSNFDTISTEFAMRFLKIYLDHLRNFTYTSEGAMLIGWDISEYGRRINPKNNASIKQLFTILDSLVDFLMLHPDNINELMSNEDLKLVDRSLIESIIHLRMDFKETLFDRLF